MKRFKKVGGKMKVIDKSFSSNNINDIIIKDLSNKELSQHEKTILSNLYVSFPKKDIEKNNPDIDILSKDLDDNSLVSILADVLQDPLAWQRLKLHYNEIEDIRPEDAVDNEVALLLVQLSCLSGSNETESNIIGDI